MLLQLRKAVMERLKKYVWDIFLLCQEENSHLISEGEKNSRRHHPISIVK